MCTGRRGSRILAMLPISNIINNAKVLRAATAINIATWLGQAVIAFTHDASGNHSVEGYPEHLQLALITLCAITLVPITLRLGARGGTGGRRAALVSAIGANCVGVLCIASNVNSGDPSFFTAVAIPSMGSWFLGTIALAIFLYRSGNVPKVYAFALPVAFLCGTAAAQTGAPVVTALFWAAMARQLGVFDPSPVLVTPGSAARRGSRA
jgi:hypothetical protein